MTAFSNDVDILKHEPVLFGELHLPSQILTSGTGAVLSGTTLAAEGADFVAAGIAAGGVIYLRSADGRGYDNLRMDSFKQVDERTGAPGIAVEYEVVYTQLGE